MKNHEKSLEVKRTGETRRIQSKRSKFGLRYTLGWFFSLAFNSNLARDNLVGAGK